MSIDLKKEIEYWNEHVFLLNPPNNRIYELAFFKIFVKFELFLSNLFIKYSIGISSETGYIAERKLLFENEQHLKAILKNNNANYVNYSEKIQSLSKEIFLSEKDPFSLVFRDPRLNDAYQKMVILRNYIAHESNESKKKYTETLIITGPFLEPGEWLIKKPRNNPKTNYTIFIEIIEEIIGILIKPNDYFQN